MDWNILLVGLFMAAEVVTHRASKVLANVMQIDVEATACSNVLTLCKYGSKWKIEMKLKSIHCCHLHSAENLGPYYIFECPKFT